MRESAVREQVRDCVALLASTSEQLEYETSVPQASAPQELIAQFADDLFQPKSQQFIDAFSEDELRDLAEFYGLLCQASRCLYGLGTPSMTEVLKLREWRAVLSHAQALSQRLGVQVAV